MESIQRPLERLVASLQWFVVAREIRLLQVLAEADLRIAVLEHIAAAEHHSRNRSPFVVLEAPVEPDDAGWGIRVDELDLEMSEVRKALSRGGAPIEPGEPAGAGERAEGNQEKQGTRGKQGLKDFGLALGAALRSVPSPLEGLTVVLAPLSVDEPSRWAADVGALLEQRELDQARFIVVGEESAKLDKLRERLGACAEVVDARVDPEASRRDTDELLSAMASSPEGVTGPRAVGAAGPKVAPPVRRTDPSVSRERQGEILAEAGVPEALADPSFSRELRLSVLGAAQAMSRSDPVEAVKRLRRAIELTGKSHLIRESLTLQIMLGSTVLQLGRVEAALPIYEEARDRAAAEGLHDLEVEALIALGLALFLCKRVDEAASAYERAGRTGAHHEQTVLAIESYRLCGQILFSRKRIEPAIHAWKRALEIAEGAPPDVAATSSAPQVARTLAEACRTHGLTAQAEALEVQAASFEALPSTPAPPSEERAAEPSSDRPSVTQTMEMIIDELFPPDDPRSEVFYGQGQGQGQGQVVAPRPDSEELVEYEATVVLKDLAAQQRQAMDRPPSSEAVEPAVVAPRPPHHDRTPSMEFEVGGILSFKLPFVSRILGFKPSFQIAGAAAYDQGSDLFAPVDMSLFTPDPKYARTAEMDSLGDEHPSPSRRRGVGAGGLEATESRLQQSAEPVIRQAHHTAHRSMELDALVLPEGFEPPPVDEDEE